jgi:hypothetical protein
MAKKDWQEIIEKFNNQDTSFLQNFLNAKDSFCPSENFINIFDSKEPYSNFSSQNIDKPKLASWIPIYKKEDLSDFMIQNNLMPIRAGQGEFFS